MSTGTNKKVAAGRGGGETIFHFNGLCISQTAYHLHTILTEIINIPLHSQQIKCFIIQFC